MRWFVILAICVLAVLLFVIFLARGGIDRVLALILPNYNHLKEEYNLSNSLIKSSELFNNSELFVVVSSSQGKFLADDTFRNSITQRGYSYLRYVYPTDILSLDYATAKNNLDEINKRIIDDLEKLRKDYHFKKIHITGVSLGCVNALIVANREDFIGDVFLVLPGDSLAQSLWESVRTRSLRKKYMEEGIGLEKLEEEWKDLAPQNNIDKLGDRNVFVILSRADRIIPYRRGESLVKRMASAGVNLKVKTTSFLGHFGTLLSLSRSPDKLIDDYNKLSFGDNKTLDD